MRLVRPDGTPASPANGYSSQTVSMHETTGLFFQLMDGATPADQVLSDEQVKNIAQALNEVDGRYKDAKNQRDTARALLAQTRHP